ncbi:MAG: Ferredoxin--NADP(+) reductase [Modestobacter sp.]|nr:Ferredoxin--NADP(+) reductase [Modestobacter sp.]
MRDRSVAIVGSGPSGFYSAGALLASAEPIVRVDLYDCLPTPWGLVRAGVAPDHPKIKSVSTQFDKIAAHERFRFFGNVELGARVTREELLERYDAVIYAVGAQTERPLGIPGEDLPGSHASIDFVGWYNGHPSCRNLGVDLSADRAVVVGNGNVALDVARMLCLPHADLARTDVADHALHALAKSSIREVMVLGRRGAAQAAFSTSELKDLDAIDALGVDVDLADVPRGGDGDDPAVSPAMRRNLELLHGWAQHGLNGAAARRIAFRFHRSPVEIRGDGRVEEIVLAVNELQADAGGRVVAVDTGVREVVPTGLVVRAVGYRGVPLAGLPFDAVRGVVPHEDGRVAGHEREYVVGWIKRGPTGIIGINRQDANQTVRNVLEDLVDATPRNAEPDEVSAWLASRQPRLVTTAGWNLIDDHERANGRAADRPRVKLVSTAELLDVALGAE